MHIYYVSLIKLDLQFYFWDFDILNYEIFYNCISNSVVSLFIVEQALYYLWFILALKLNSKNKFIIVKLTMWMLCIMDGQIVCFYSLLANR